MKHTSHHFLLSTAVLLIVGGIVSRLPLWTSSSGVASSAPVVRKAQACVADCAVASPTDPIVAFASSSAHDPSIGSVSTSPVTGAWGMVVLVPQFHQNPGSAPADTANDRAEKTQREIVSFLPSVVRAFSASLVMVEGDLFGPVSPAKTQAIDSFSAAHDALVQGIASLKMALAAHPSQGKDALAAAEERERALSRELTLRGAPYVVHAKGVPVTLYGSETPETLAKSAELVRNYVYLQDRAAAVQKASAPASSSEPDAVLSSSSNVSDAEFQKLELLKRLLGEDVAPADEVTALKVSALRAKEQDVADAAGLVAQALQDADRAEADLRNATASHAASPSRAENPYAALNDPVQIENKLKQMETQINDLVVEQRSQEASDNIAKAMKANGAKAAVLQYGAGHEDGLVRGLNANGLTVVIVTPHEVEVQDGTTIR